MIDPVYQAQETVLVDYVNLLGRLPETSAANYWSNLLLTKNWTAQQVAGAIGFSPEGIIAQQTQDVTSLYLAFFKRAPDALGLKYWADLYHQGTMSLNQIADAFLNSAEGKAAYPGTMSNAAAVTKLYSTLFLTQPTAEKVDGYVNALNSGLSFSALATSLASEYKTGSLTNPADALQNQVFLNFLQATRVGDPSYDAANSTFHLPDGGIYDIPSVLNVSPPPPVTSDVSLGSTAKAYVGTDKNDTWEFNLSTWNSGNSFDGRGGYDTIVLDARLSRGDYNIRGNYLRGIELLDVDARDGSYPIGVSLTQGFQTDYNEKLLMGVYSSWDHFNIKLRWTNVLFNPQAEKSASDVNAPGEWYFMVTKNGKVDLTYFDSVNQRAQGLITETQNFTAEVKVLGGDIIIYDL